MRVLVALSYVVLLAGAPSTVSASEGPGGTTGEGEAARGVWHRPFDGFVRQPKRQFNASTTYFQSLPVSIERWHRPAFYSQRHRILVGWPGATTLEPGPPSMHLVVQFQPPPSISALEAFSRKFGVTVLAEFGNGRYVLLYDDPRPPSHVADEMKRERAPRVVNVEQVM